jgi:nickel-dependent lactate racemase
MESNIQEDKDIEQCVIESLQDYQFRNKDILIVSEDNTRSSPVHKIFPLVRRIVENKGAKSIKILFALGTHRPMTEEEIKAKLGLEYLDGIKCFNHNWLDEEELTSIRRFGGYDCKINKKLLECDMIIGFSNTIPHRVAGFTGGSKLFCPGVSNREMIGYTHWISATIPRVKIIGTSENPVRQIFDKVDNAIDKEKISFNFVLSDKGVVGLFVGGFKESYMKACELSRKVHVKELAPRNYVIAHVDDVVPDLWQGAKAIYNCSNAVSDDGLLVVKGEFREGISVHGDVLKNGYNDLETVKKLLKQNEIGDLVVAAHLVHVGEILKRINVKIWSDNISKEECKKLNIGYLSNKDAQNLDYDYEIAAADRIYIKPNKIK